MMLIIALRRTLLNTSRKGHLCNRSDAIPPVESGNFRMFEQSLTGCGKSRSVESEENQKQVFLASHRPWKSRTTRAIPTFPTAPAAAGIYEPNN
jgi:hypothetical protein